MTIHRICSAICIVLFVGKNVTETKNGTKT
nr:MAG TPA: hypothetical protein [Caudoviricetes sp.]